MRCDPDVFLFGLLADGQMKVSIIEAPKWIVKKMDNPSKVGDLVPL